MSGSWAPGPPEPRATPRAVDLWLADLDAAGPPPPRLLSAAEEERRSRIRTPEGGRRWAASRWGLRVVLGRYLARAPAAVELTSGEHGKPALAGDRGGLEFNLSHSGARALFAVTLAQPVGVDVEQVAPRGDLLALAERGLDPDAAAAVRAADPERREAAFYAAWTAHEARLKCHGGGIGGPPPDGPIAVAALELGPGYAGAVAVPGEQTPQLRRYLLELR